MNIEKKHPSKTSLWPLGLLGILALGFIIRRFRSKNPVVNQGSQRIAAQSETQHQTREPHPPQQPERISAETHFSPEEGKRYYGDQDKTYKLQRRTFWVGIFTLLVLGVYTYYTIRMYCANQKAADAARDAANTSSDSFKVYKEATETEMRPYVTLEHVEFAYPPALHRDLFMFGQLINSGNTPAIDVTCVDCYVFIKTKGGTYLKTAQTYPPVPIGGKSDRKTAFGTDDHVEQSQMDLKATGAGEIFIRGRLKYRNVYDGKWYDDYPFCYSWGKGAWDYKFGWCGVPRKNSPKPNATPKH